MDLVTAADALDRRTHILLKHNQVLLPHECPEVLPDPQRLPSVPLHVLLKRYQQPEHSPDLDQCLDLTVAGSQHRHLADLAGEQRGHLHRGQLVATVTHALQRQLPAAPPGTELIARQLQREPVGVLGQLRLSDCDLRCLIPDHGAADPVQPPEQQGRHAHLGRGRGP